jgi:hypothetical protein
MSTWNQWNGRGKQGLSSGCMLKDSLAPIQGSVDVCRRCECKRWRGRDRRYYGANQVQLKRLPA